MDLAEFVRISRIGNVQLEQPGQKRYEGDLCLTSHQIIFSSSSEDPKGAFYTEILHTKVSSVHKTAPAALQLRLRDFTALHLTALGSSAESDVQKAIETIEKLSSIEDLELQYPFYYHPRFTAATRDGWTLYDVESEFNRMGCPPNKWRISHANADFSLCRTYPKSVIVPKGIDDETLARVARFRRGGRFPVLSYHHTKETAILRSSEPLSGTPDKRSRDDETLLKASLSPRKRGFIIDTRSHFVAQQRRNRGGGVEIEAHYPHWRRVHCSLDVKLPALAESLQKLVDACADQNIGTSSWMSKVESSSWLAHVCDLLTAACSVAQCVDRDCCTVLVHGSEGTDSTLQVSSLAQVLLDPHCRTIVGFQVLVEREWIKAGHPFTGRCGNVSSQSPVFLVFLECVWQVMQQFPLSFEFNEELLILLFNHACSSAFGTFLGNSEFSRSEIQVEEKCSSLWSYLDQETVLEGVRNLLYSARSGVLWPSVAAQTLHIWKGLYFKAVLGPRPQTEVAGVIRDIVQDVGKVEEEVEALKKELRGMTERVN